MSTAQESVVEFYWRPGCPFCMMLRADLDHSGLPLREVNIWEDPEAAARVRSVADGNETVPTVFVGPVGMVNPDLDEILAAVRVHAPELLGAGTDQ
ncbi:NrdH-redoxin [Amycolatopsis rhizosphaerae]|uniref:NrdH-redoxin n=1 Tax=Amycolatopsis rhizosphaerae TaxID=2053003 RepID=A0A558CXX7_9PSEU|nr:glutaredoxin domain-containing protein [Amycolatopsis rhizosphaerae]TVT53621.1 NrdH-redoxin [Amycolatopsis rhizosphaerae]